MTNIPIDQLELDTYYYVLNLNPNYSVVLEDFLWTRVPSEGTLVLEKWKRVKSPDPYLYRFRTNKGRVINTTVYDVGIKFFQTKEEAEKVFNVMKVKQLIKGDT